MTYSGVTSTVSLSTQVCQNIVSKFQLGPSLLMGTMPIPMSTDQGKPSRKSLLHAFLRSSTTFPRSGRICRPGKAFVLDSPHAGLVFVLAGWNKAKQRWAEFAPNLRMPLLLPKKQRLESRLCYLHEIHSSRGWASTFAEVSMDMRGVSLNEFEMP